jgi:hypothetical protein
VDRVDDPHSLTTRDNAVCESGSKQDRVLVRLHDSRTNETQVEKLLRSQQQLRQTLP